MSPSVNDRLEAIGLAAVQGSETTSLAREDVAMLLELAGAALEIDPDYEKRAGYDPRFLGDVVGPFPSVTDPARVADLVLVGEEGDAELRYHHFSVVMSRSRRLAVVTAVNIDARKRLPVLRSADRWVFDARIDQDLQTGDELYMGNALDRGHLVRRQDPVWGDELAEGVAANNDTFHFTNCAPQHSGFNQSPLTWHGLEDHILNNASSHELKVSVFTGPVLADDDPVYRGVALPRRYWKVVVTIREDGSPSVTAYLLSQEQLIDDLAAEVFTFGAYRTFQVPVLEIEGLTGLGFGDELRAADPLIQRAAAARIEVGRFSDLVL